MSALDSEAQERLVEVKDFFKDHGKALGLAVLVAILVAVGAWWWRWHGTEQSRQANALYFEIVKQASSGDDEKVVDLAGELADKYPSTAYASLGLLVAARVNVDRKDIKNAKAELTWVKDKGASDELRDLARLRLASLVADEKSYDEALKILAPAPVAHMADLYAELRGDIQFAQGHRDQAQASYKEALGKITAEAGDGKNTNDVNDLRGVQRRTLELKLDSLAGA